jgi:tripartite-type tricarboxylate transporter receptor subunit TctC
MKATDFWIGGLGPESDKDIRMRMQLDMLGLKYRYISNYPGSSEARLALDRGEIQLFTDSIPTYRAAIEPQVAAGKLLPLWHDPVDDGERFSASPDAAGVPAPTFVDFVVKQKGALPSGPMWEAYRVLNVVGTTFLRTLTLPPGAPKEAAESLRAAIDDIDKDPGFGAEAAAVLKFVPRYQTDDNTATLFRKRLAPDPAIVAFLRDYIEKGRERLGK